MEIERIYSEDPAEWETVADFLVVFILELIEKEKPPADRRHV